MRLLLLPIVAFALLVTTAGGVAYAQEQFAAVVNRIVYPGQTVDAAEVQEVPFKPTGRIAGPVAQSHGEVAGKVAKRTLLPGHLFQLSALREPYAVEAGEPVLASFVHGALSITATVVPLEPGAVGDMVRLRNPDSGKVLTGIVLADGSVRLSR